MPLEKNSKKQEEIFPKKDTKKIEKPKKTSEKKIIHKKRLEAIQPLLKEIKEETKSEDFLKSLYIISCTDADEMSLFHCPKKFSIQDFQINLWDNDKKGGVWRTKASSVLVNSKMEEEEEEEEEAEDYSYDDELSDSDEEQSGSDSDKSEEDSSSDSD